MQIFQQDYKITTPYCCINNAGRPPYVYRTGHYICKHGIVKIYAEREHVSFDVVLRGRMYSKSISDIEKPFTDRQLAVYAGKFIREIITKFC